MDIDFLLLQRMKRGDENAFNVFVRKYYKEILNYCNYHCPDTSTAEDLTQETFLRFFEKLSDYRYMGKTKNYLYTMIGVLFIVLMIPEFWKNKSCDCMQIEATCLYSLRQIYAARIFLFGIVDLFMISLFCITLRGSVNLALSEIVIQFLFPAVVTACICFGTLCSNSRVNEGTSIILCLLWSGIWWFIINNETIYVLITLPVWYALFGTAVVFLIGAIYKTIFDCNKFWEVDLSGTTIS